MNASALLAASFLGITALSLHVRPDAEIVAVVFPPWWSTPRVFGAAASAHAAIVRITAVNWIVVVRPDREAGLARLRQSGGWLTIDPQAIAACLSNKEALR